MPLDKPGHDRPDPDARSIRARKKRINLDREAARRRDLVERRILDAMADGLFDNLPGTGRPLDLRQPHGKGEEIWWALRTLEQANVVTDEVRYRQEIRRGLEALRGATSEPRVREAVRRLNEWILKLNTMGTNVIPTTLTTFDERAEIERFRARTGSPQPPPPAGAETGVRFVADAPGDGGAVRRGAASDSSPPQAR